MAPQMLTSKQIMALLAATPGRLAALTEGLSPAQPRAAPSQGTDQEPGQDEWSANEVLAHLRACADMWGGSITRMLAEDRPTLRAINPRTWIKQTDYLSLEFQSSLGAFTAQRAALLAALEPLAPAGWSRAATVTGAGKPLVRTVRDYAERLAVHERPHVKQIERVVAAVRR